MEEESKSEWRKKPEGQKKRGSQEQVGGGYRKEIEDLRWPIKLPGVTSNPPDFTFRALVYPSLESPTPAHFIPVASKPCPHLPQPQPYTGVSAASPHDSPFLHPCGYFPELSQLGGASLSHHQKTTTTTRKNKRRLNVVERWQESDLRCWDGIQHLCREVQWMLTAVN